MKNDKEIKEFIDSKEVLTIKELSVFVYPNWGENALKKSMSQKYRVKEWWSYVLKTKDWGKLQEYKKHKIYDWNLDKERYKKFTELYKRDERIRVWGSRKLKDFLLGRYNIVISRSSIQQYKKRLGCIAKSN